MRLLVLFFLLCFSFTSIASDKTRVREAISFYLKNNFLNSTFRFANDSETLNSGAYGVFFREEGIQLKSNQVMPIASVTKPIVAAAILILQEQGKLKVTDKISKFFGKNDDLWNRNMPQWAREISIHNLLTHSSGLFEYYKNFDIGIKNKTNLYEINKSIISFISSKNLEFKPGTKYQYSNSNFVLLGLIIEKVTKKELRVFLAEAIFNKLDMHSTYMPSLEETIKIQETDPDQSTYPVRYVLTATKPKIKLQMDKNNMGFLPYADGGVFSNTRDIVNFYRALCNHKIISEASYKMMTKKYFKVGEVKIEEKEFNTEQKSLSAGSKYDIIREGSRIQNREKKDPSKSNKGKTQVAKNALVYAGYGIFITQLPEMLAAKDNNKANTMISASHNYSAISDAGCLLGSKLYFAILGNVSTDQNSIIAKENIDPKINETNKGLVNKKNNDCASCKVNIIDFRNFILFSS